MATVSQFGKLGDPYQITKDINIFRDDKDILDRAVEGYEEKVPLLSQIGIGFTLPGLAIDAAETAKYGRDAYRDFSSGDVKRGLMNTGIAGLSALGFVPVIGDYLKGLGKEPLQQGLLALPPPPSMRFEVGKPIDERKFSDKELRVLQNDFNAVQKFDNADEMFETAKRVNPSFQNEINKIAGNLGHRTVGNPGETKLSMIGDMAEQEGKVIYSGAGKDFELDEFVGNIDEATGQPLGQVKKIPRIIEKSAQKYGGDINQITDPIRTRVIVDTAQEAREVANQIGKRFEMIDSGNQVNVVGMRDRKLNIRYTDPNTGEQVIAEIGVTTLPMHKAAEIAHHDYNLVRTVLKEFKSTIPGVETVDNIPPAIKKYYDISMENMKEVFGEADKMIDKSWLELKNVKKYRYGGYVTSGNSGSSAPSLPNSFSKSSLEMFPTFIHSGSNITSAGTQESDPDGMYLSNEFLSPPSITTEGTPSQLKYKLPDIF